jgi:membrane protein
VAGFRNSITALKSTFGLFGRNDPLMLSGATAFFAAFAISPIIIILMNAFTLYFERDSIRPQLFHKIESVFGIQTTKDIQTIVDNIRVMESSVWITIFSFIFFVFVGTTLLSVVRNAIHRIWGIALVQRKKITTRLRERFLGIVMILLMGALFLVALMMDTFVAVFRDYLVETVPAFQVTLIRITNIIFSIAVVTIWFTLVFKMLPEARVRWRVAMAGGLLTGILFSIGKFVLGKILIHGRIAAIFGTSTSIALLLLFIFYSSLILYFGTAFTFEYGKASGKQITHR